MNKIVLAGFLTGGLAACSVPPPSDTSIRIRWANDPESLDPLALPNQNAIDAANLLQVSLLQVDYEKQVFAPALADSLPEIRLQGDSLTLLSYRLRAAATWDDGRPILASDVAFTLKLMQAPGLPNEGAKAQFSFIRQLVPNFANARAFTLVCRGQAPEFAQASGDFPILSEKALDPRGELRSYSLAQLIDRLDSTPPDTVLTALAHRYAAAAPAVHPERLPGCGPYRLIAWEKDHTVRFQRKAHWWADRLKPAPLVLQAHPQRLEFTIIPDNAGAAQALQRGEVDVYPQVPAREFARMRASTAAQKRLAFYTAPSYELVTAGFNTRLAMLADRLTRQALARLFDTDNLIKATQQGEGSRTVGLISPADKQNYNSALPLLSLDVMQAAALLRQAGWQQTAGGWQRPGTQGKMQQLAFTVSFRSDDATFETIGLQFRAAAEKLGITVRLQPAENSTFTAALQAGNFDVYIRTIKGNPTIFNFMPILHSQSVGEGNFTGFTTPASDRLIENVAVARTPTDKARLLHEFQAMMREEMPLVPLFFLPNRIAASRQLAHLYVGGLKPGYAAAAIMRATEVPASR